MRVALWSVPSGPDLAKTAVRGRTRFHRLALSDFRFFLYTSTASFEAMAGQCSPRPAMAGLCAMSRVGSPSGGSSRPRKSGGSRPRRARRRDTAPDFSGTNATRFPHNTSDDPTDPTGLRARDLARRLVRDAAVVVDRVVKGKAQVEGSVSGQGRDKAAAGKWTWIAPTTSTRHVAFLDEPFTEIGRRAAAVAASVVVATVLAAATPDTAYAGFGAPTGVVSSPPLPEQQLEELLSMDRRAGVRKTNLIRTSDFDILLQELNALTQLDEKALEAADAEIALRISENLAVNMKDATESLKSPQNTRMAVERNAAAGASDASSSTEFVSKELTSQRLRLLERRLVEVEFQKKLFQRKVDESRLASQPQVLVYGAALAASVLSTAVMHPVDTIKVRKQALGAEKLRATSAAEFWNDATESTAFYVASATTVAASAAVDARVVAAAETGPGASFHEFDDRPAAAWGSGSFEEPETLKELEEVSSSTTTTATKERTTGATQETSWNRAFDDLTTTYGADYSPYEEAQMPMSSALAAVALSNSSPAKIFAPIGVPLTPQGLASLYDGLLPNIVKEGPPLALYLGIYEYLKCVLLATDLKATPVVCYLIAGAVGELVGSVLRVPAEAVKSTQQSRADITLPEALSLNFGTKEGRANCVEAWTVAVVRDVPFGAIQIALFEALKIYISGVADPPFDGDSALGEAILGAIGGGVGAFISAPADVVVVRLIKQQTQKSGDGDGEKKLGAADMAKLVFEEGGVPAFFRGSTERVLYWAPAIGIFLTAYCQIRHALIAA